MPFNGLIGELYTIPKSNKKLEYQIRNASENPKSKRLWKKKQSKHIRHRFKKRYGLFLTEELLNRIKTIIRSPMAEIIAQPYSERHKVQAELCLIEIDNLKIYPLIHPATREILTFYSEFMAKQEVAKNIKHPRFQDLCLDQDRIDA